MNAAILTSFRNELQQELTNILSYWQRHTPDIAEGGFYGKIDHADNVIAGAAKGAVLNARVLWSFSAAAVFTNKHEYALTAKRAYDYFIDHFIDKEYGGVYWSVDHTGQPHETKKQTYAIAFAVYGLSEYFKCSKDEQAKVIAVGLYQTILKHTYDPIHGGYFEAFSRDWKEVGDLRLSAKDANEKKSMNTHLHVIEAFSNLYEIWPDEGLKKKIEELLQIFEEHIIDKNTFHLKLFFSENWVPQSSMISYGHDIEAAWLLLESALLIKDMESEKKFKSLATALAVAAKEGLDTNGGLWYEAENGHIIQQQHWWPQAEAMVGFFTAGEISNNPVFLQDALNSWHFIKEHIVDKKNGEWVWGIEPDGSVINKEDKVGIWKCPYHNTRACMEMIKRIGQYLK